MKKFLSLLLAAMMLLSCATAMAKTHDTLTNSTSHTWEGSVSGNKNAGIDVRVEDTRYTDEFQTNAKEAEAATEIWLQVDATGQIDVTVPLVLVFQTDIDGGTATSPTDYKFINYSSADLVITQIATTKIGQTPDDSKVQQPMEMIAFYKEDGKTETKLEEDQYKVRIKDIAGARGNKNGTKNPTEYDLFTEKDGVRDVLHTTEAYQGGLFELKKAPENDYDAASPKGEPTALAVEMKTGRLSFVTSRKDPAQGDAVEDTKGIQLLTIVYTVAIDTSDAFGEKITDDNTYTHFTATGDAAEDVHTHLAEETEAEASEDNEADDK